MTTPTYRNSHAASMPTVPAPAPISPNRHRHVITPPSVIKTYLTHHNLSLTEVDEITVEISLRIFRKVQGES